MATCRQIHIVSLPYSKTRPGLDAHITKRTAILLLLDIVATYAAYWLASLLTDVEGEVFVNNEIYFMLGILALINVAVLGLFHLYNNLWEYASVDEAIQIVLAVVLSTLVGAVFLWIIDVRLPIRVFFVSCFMLIFFMGGIRLIFRVMRQKRRALVSTQRMCDRPRTLVVGAGETGSLAIGRMASKDPLMPGIPIVATDDDPTKRGSRIHGVKVAGSTNDIVDLVDKHNIDQIVVAIPSSTPEERKRIYGECTKTDCKLRTLPNVRELSLDEIGDVRLRDVDVADLLGREEIILNTRAVSGYIAGECVLVTGGGGSIGSELCRQLCRVAPARFIFSSTDKAVNPTSVMGATKRMGEMVVQLYARTSKTVFSAVRFGNVLGSNGSVIPVFQRQIAAGGPVTVTHPEIERFFMTIPEASRLVIQAGGMAHGGEIFILDMGEPVKIVELAKGLIQLQGLVPDVDVKITFTGLRDGEKMYEELLMDEESTLPTDNKSIMISTGQEISYDEVAAKLGELEAAIGKSDEEAVHILESAVPTYRHTKNCA